MKKKKMPYINKETCAGCSVCVENCPMDCLSIEEPKFHGDIHTIACVDETKCIGCGICEKTCTAGAVKVTDHCAVIDEAVCLSCGMCVVKCPRHVLTDLRGIIC